VIGAVVVRDRWLLASAAARPSSIAFGEDAYRTFPEKAAALMHSLARNHALVDGNSRLAWAATRVFCLLNGRDLAFTVEDGETMVQAIARGELEARDVAAMIWEWPIALLTEIRSTPPATSSEP
jgi:death on curing protein